MKLSKLCFIIICLILFAGNTAFATNYYIDPSAIVGSKTGTLVNPWTAMSQGINSLLPGDTVFLKNGQTYPGNLNITKSGSFGQPIVFTGYGAGSMPVFTYSSGNENAIHLSKVSYVVIDGLKITDPTLSSDAGHNVVSNITSGIYVQNSLNCTIKNCDISLVGTGISIGSGSDFTTVTNNHIYNLRMVVNTPRNINSNDDYGAVGMGIESSNNTVSYNRFEDNWAVSYDYGYDGGVIEFFGNTSNNTIIYNSANYCNGFLEIGSGGSGTSDNNIFAYNKIVNCGQIGSFHVAGSFGTNINNCQFYNNVFVQTITDVQVFDAILFWAEGTPTSGMLIAKNNIFWSTVLVNYTASPISSSNFTHTNNLLNLGSGSLNLSLGSGETQIISSPWTATSGDPYTWNYALSTGSAAINFGTNVGITKDFNGNTIIGNPDAGIIEHSSSFVNALKVTSTATPISCYGGTSTINIDASGGTAPYNGIGAFTVNAGNYNYTVTDATGINSTISVTVTQPDAILSTITAGTISTIGGSTSVSVSATGGTGAFSYNLNGAASQTASVFSNVLAGIYTVVIKDVNECVSNQSITINQLAGGTVINNAKFSISAYPNASNNYFTISINNYSGNQPIGITVFTILGGLIYKSVGSNANNQYTFGSDFVSGIYLLNVNIGGVSQALKLIKL